MKLKVLLTSLAVIMVAHGIGVFRNWYWAIWWYDIPMHLAGGAWAALVFFYLAEEKWNIVPRAYAGKKGVIMIFVLALGFTALLGIGWEFFEYLYDVFVAKRHGFFFAEQGLTDTMGDFVNDLAGGFSMVAVRLFFRRKGSVDKNLVGDSAR